jgi:predicted O-methyltransferase YrrM
MTGPEGFTSRLHPETASDVLDIAWAFQSSRTLLTACELDVFTALGGASLTAAEVAARVEADALGVERLLHALCALGLVGKEDGRFSNEPVSQRCLVEGAEEFLSAGYIAYEWDNWSRLTDAVRRGKPAIVQPFRDPLNIWTGALYSRLRAFGIRVVRVVGRSDVWLRAFVDYMRDHARRRSAAVVELLDMEGVTRLLDVGGGPAHYAMAFARSVDGLEATVFDRPEVVKIADRNIARAGLTDRVRTIGGDFNAADLGSEYDFVFISETVHANSAAENAILVRNAAAALQPGGRLVIQDFILENDRTGPPYAAVFSLYMLIVKQGGDNYTDAEVRRWMTDAGLERIERQETGLGTALMVAYKPSD